MRADWGEELTVDLWRFHCGCERRGAANSGADGAVGISDPIGSRRAFRDRNSGGVAPRLGRLVRREKRLSVTGVVKDDAPVTDATLRNPDGGPSSSLDIGIVRRYFGRIAIGRRV